MKNVSKACLTHLVLALTVNVVKSALMKDTVEVEFTADDRRLGAMFLRRVTLTRGSRGASLAIFRL